MNAPFEGDKYIGLELIKLRDRFGLTNCIESGTQYGATAWALKKIFNKVVTIEADMELFSIPKNNGCINMFGYSQELIKDILFKDTLLYLDAHGGAVGGCPLKLELEAIHEAIEKYPLIKNICIAIHDFKVPDRPDLGYDTYDYELSFEEVEPYIKKIYPEGFDYHFNDKAEGAKRGIAYFYPVTK